jgi:hypothetical protein
MTYDQILGFTQIDGSDIHGVADRQNSRRATDMRMIAELREQIEHLQSQLVALSRSEVAIDAAIKKTIEAGWLPRSALIQDRTANREIMRGILLAALYAA